MKRFTGMVPSVLVLALATGCGEDEGVAGVPTAVAQGLLARGQLAVYNGGVDRAAPAQPCADDPPHRQFDFWLGDVERATAPERPRRRTNGSRPGWTAAWSQKAGRRPTASAGAASTRTTPTWGSGTRRGSRRSRAGTCAWRAACTATRW